LRNGLETMHARGEGEDASRTQRAAGLVRKPVEQEMFVRELVDREQTGGAV
jgi:hypothetical protein